MGCAQTNRHDAMGQVAGEFAQKVHLLVEEWIRIAEIDGKGAKRLAIRVQRQSNR